MDSWIFCGVIFIATLTVVQPKPTFRVTPIDVTTEEGQSVNLTCAINITPQDQDTIRWSRIVHTDEPFGETIYTYYIDDAPSDSTKFTAYGDNKLLTLQIHNVQFEDAGIYICEMIKNAEKSTSNLIVLGPPVPITPTSTLTSGTTVDVSCEVTFAAPREEEISEGQMPVMKTFLDTQQLTTQDETFPGLPGTKWWQMKQTAQITVMDADDGKELICSIETSNPYYHLDARDNIWVQHAVSKVEVMGQEDVYYVGDVINCTANGNPEPSFEWQPIKVPQMTGSKTYQSQYLELTSNLVGQNTWKCVATNNVGQRVMQETEISFEVKPNPYDAQSGASTGGGSSTVAIVLGVVIPIIVIGVVLVVGFLVYKHKMNKDPKNAEKTPDVPKDLPPNPRPPGKVQVLPPQVYDPEEGRRKATEKRKNEPENPDLGSGSPLLEEEPRPARPTPQPRYQNSNNISPNDSATTDV